MIVQQIETPSVFETNIRWCCTRCTILHFHEVCCIESNSIGISSEQNAHLDSREQKTIRDEEKKILLSLHVQSMQYWQGLRVNIDQFVGIETQLDDIFITESRYIIDVRALNRFSSFAFGWCRILISFLTNNVLILHLCHQGENYQWSWERRPTLAVSSILCFLRHGLLSASLLD